MALNLYLTFTKSKPGGTDAAVTPSIKDEETDDKHKEWIKALDYSLNVEQPVSHDVGSLGTGKASFGPLEFTKRVTLSSPIVMAHTAQNKRMEFAVLDVCRMIEGINVTIMRYIFHDVLVNSIDLIGSQESDGTPKESCSLVYNKIEWFYTAYDTKNKKGGNTSMEFDVRQGKGK
jgi:type VI secretion system secreted protein Hcp